MTITHVKTLRRMITRVSFDSVFIQILCTQYVILELTDAALPTSILSTPARDFELFRTHPWSRRLCWSVNSFFALFSRRCAFKERLFCSSN